MPLIHFVKDRPSITTTATTTLMDALLAAGQPVASSCRGDGVCGKCRVRVLAGPENLSPAGERERRRATELKLDPDQRLSCQAYAKGDVTLDTSYW